MSRRILVAKTNDHHCGSTVAVCPPEVRLDDGGYYGASPEQLWLWQCYGDFWEKVAEKRERENAELVAVFNGDLTDGNHHGTTQIMSGNPNAQAAAVNACMKVALDKKPSRIYMVRGTEAHVGPSAAHEERIADGLRRDGRPIVSDPKTGNASWWHCHQTFEGVRVDIAHHGRTGQREHTRGGAAVLHAHDILMSYVKRNDLPPHLALRAHHHRFNDSYDACPVRVITNGAWQLATAYVHRKCTDTLADIGGLLITMQDGEYEAEKVHFPPKDGSVWTA